MAKKNLRENMLMMMSEGITDEEHEMLSKLGFKMKKPNKYTVIAAALYKKASSGDLSAIKELRSIMGDTQPEQEFCLVRILDDIRG